MNEKSRKRDLPCEEVRSLLELLAAGDLPDDEAARVLEHVDSCPGCSILFEKIDEPVKVAQQELFATAAELGEPVDLWPAIKREIGQRQKKKNLLGWLTFRPVRLVTSAVVLTAGLYILVMIQAKNGRNGGILPPVYESTPVVISSAHIDAHPAEVTGFESSDGKTVMLWLE